MPIRLLSLPIADIRYAIRSMDIDDLIAFSLCSKRTKDLVKSSNRKTEAYCAEIDENMIRLELYVFDLDYRVEKQFEFVVREGSSIELQRGNGIEILTKEGYTQSDWIAHLLSFTDSRVLDLKITNVPSIAYLDTVKQLFPKCPTLQIGRNCSIELTKAAVSKYLSDVEGIYIGSNQFNEENHISQFLNLNLKYLHLGNWQTPCRLDSNDLLLANSAYLTISSANITEKALNRFLKLWMKGNHRFYRPEQIELQFRNEINCEEVLRGIKHEDANKDELYPYQQKSRLKRADGKELLMSALSRIVNFEFRG
ncbi:hypothetical protein B9Z55_021599 [Caenorhabditis nigoni]|uniref:F-box domain-containing protein n=1 Tax=Caenorhabditis nigoni TaxID=1611254 RepID=A0A2G5TSN6_9PELO|nr:hypothetical protein B9Z55_021599 [Caenorhabditis nigoni]